MRHLLDLDRYPLDRPDTPAWASLVDACRSALAADGMFSLDGFMRAASVAADVAQLTPRFAGESFRHVRRHNIYFQPSVAGLAADHPALAEVATSNRTLCGDQATGTALAALYEWPAFAAFLAATMEKPALFTMDDPLARLNVMIYGCGEALNWHFDRSEFTTTLLLQAPEGGGAFEYRCDLRSDGDPNYDGVARLLAGGDPSVRQLALAPGTLNVFRGRNTAHRVTPVEGGRPRMVAVFSFYDRPGVCFSAEERRGFYGRA